MAELSSYCQKRHYVYGLCDPDTLKVRYVGCSVNPNSRLHGKFSPRVKSWIEAVRKKGKRPAIIILAIADGFHRGRIIEKKQIRRYTAIDPKNLLNIAERYPMTPQGEWEFECYLRERARAQRLEWAIHHRRRNQERRAARWHREKLLAAGQAVAKKRGDGSYDIEFNGFRGNVGQWARHLGLSRQRLDQRIKKYGLETALATPKGAAPPGACAPSRPENKLRDGELFLVDAAEVLGKSLSTVRVYVRLGMLGARSVDGYVAVRKRDVLKVKGNPPKRGRPRKDSA